MLQIALIFLFHAWAVVKRKGIHFLFLTQAQKRSDLLKIYLKVHLEWKSFLWFPL